MATKIMACTMTSLQFAGGPPVRHFQNILFTASGQVASCEYHSACALQGVCMPMDKGFSVTKASHCDGLIPRKHAQGCSYVHLSVRADQYETRTECLPLLTHRGKPIIC